MKQSVSSADPWGRHTLPFQPACLPVPPCLSNLPVPSIAAGTEGTCTGTLPIPASSASGCPCSAWLLCCATALPAMTAMSPHLRALGPCFLSVQVEDTWRGLFAPRNGATDQPAAPPSAAEKAGAALAEAPKLAAVPTPADSKSSTVVAPLVMSPEVSRQGGCCWCVQMGEQVVPAPAGLAAAQGPWWGRPWPASPTAAASRPACAWLSTCIAFHRGVGALACLPAPRPACRSLDPSVPCSPACLLPHHVSLQPGAVKSPCCPSPCPSP